METATPAIRPPRSSKLVHLLVRPILWAPGCLSAGLKATHPRGRSGDGPGPFWGSQSRKDSMRRLIVFGTVALLMTPSVAWAQEPPAVVPGARVRITESGTGGRGLLRGTVVTMSADTVVLRFDRGGEAVPISLARVSRIEVSRGSKRHTAAGLGLGFLAGAGTGALVGALTCESSSTCTGGSDGSLTGIHALLWGGVGAAVGTLVGGVIGASHKTERWERVSSSHWGLTIGPGRQGGFALAVSLRF